MEGEKSPQLFLEQDIIQANEIHERQRLSVENALAIARNLLISRIGDNGDNMFTLLMRLITKILSEKPENAIDFFEEYCRLVKRDHFIHPDFQIKDLKGANLDHQVDYAKRILRVVRSFEDTCNPSNPCPPSIAQLAPTWSHIGFALPPSMDYFIDRKMEQLHSSGDKVKHVRFWGVIHTLTSQYYIIELERDNLEAFQLEYQLSQEKTQIARDVIEGLIRATVSDDSLVSDWCGAESMVMDMLERIFEGAIPPDTDVDLATAVAVPVLDGVIEEAIDAAQEPEVELSMMGSLEVISCSATVESSDLSLDQLKFAAAKTLVEVKLNVFRYFVCPDPSQDDWKELPGISMEKITASRDVRSYFKGDLDAPLRYNPNKLFGGERDYLRAVLARISMDRFACPAAEDGIKAGSTPQLISNRDVTAFYKATEFPRDWSGNRSSRIALQKSSIWPGSFTLGSEHIYFGWGLENGAENGN